MVRKSPARPVLTVALLVCLAAPVRAADDWPVPRGPSREPFPYSFDRSQVKAIPRPFLEDAAACTLYAGNSNLVEPDGTIENVTHEITRLNGRKGIEKVGEYRNIVWDPSYQKLTLHLACIHKTNGQVCPVEPRHLQVRDVATDYQVYNRDKQLIISFPSLEVGDIVEVKWTLRGKNPEHAGQFFTRYTFGDDLYPVVLDEFVVRLPKEKPFHFASQGGTIEPVRTEEGGFRTYRWRARNCRRLPQDENLPPKEELRLGLACSTFASWQDIAAWKHHLRADAWKCTDDVRAIVRQITTGMTDPVAKARALTCWVRRNIRYISTGEKHDFTPHPPSRVLANRFGDCKDTSQLLAVMLHEAGIDVALATLGVLDDGQVLDNVPSPWGTHAILLVTIAGKEHWIDTTATLAPWDFLPREDRDRLCYVVDDQGRFRLVRTPPLTTADQRIEQTTEVWIGADGSSRCQREVVSHGSAALAQRDAFVEVPVGERRRQVAAELQEANSRTRLLRLAIEEAALEDYDQPVTARLAFEVTNQFSGSPDREGSLTDSKVWSRLLAYTLDYERQVPFVLPAPFESRHRYVVHLPPAYQLDSLPSNRTIRSAWGFFHVRVHPIGDGDGLRDLEIEFHTCLEKTRVEPAAFDAFRKFHEDVNQAYRAWLTLKPVQDLVDAPALEAVLAWAPQDSATATILARIYQQSNREADARRVLARARFYRPDEASLWELTVKSAATPKEEEEAQRELVRRFPGEPRHALALGSTLVAYGKQEEARKVLEPLTRKGTATQRAQAHYHLARSCYRHGQPEQALEHFNQAAQIDPDTVHTLPASLLQGHLFEDLGRPADAVRVYREALTLDRDCQAALDCLIRLTLADKDRLQTLDYLRRYTVVVGEDVTGLLQAADYYLRLERFDDAFELASRVRKQQFHEKAERILGLVCLHRGDAAGALQHLGKAEIDATVLEGLIRASITLGNLCDLAPRLDRVEKLDKPSATLRRLCAEGRELRRRRTELGKDFPAPPGKEATWTAALDVLVCGEAALAKGRPVKQVERLLAQLPEEIALGPVYALRGRLALERGKLSVALEAAEQAVALSPRYAGGYYVRGRVRLERQLAGARADLEKAAELSGQRDAEVLHYLAAALSREGHWPEAITAQRAAVKLKPKNAEMVNQLSRFEKAAGTPGVSN
jgi:tetratricopeptide (TPR) repeat protein